MTTSALKELDKNHQYVDGEYFGEADSRKKGDSTLKVIVKIEGGRIKSIEKRNPNQSFDDCPDYEKTDFLDLEEN